MVHYEVIDSLQIVVQVKNYESFLLKFVSNKINSNNLLLDLSIFRSVSGAGDETVTGSNDKNITGDTIQKFIEYLNDSATSSNNSM